jgi:hypothetical protein
MIEISGHIRARGEINDNRDFNDAIDDATEAYNTRVNLMLKATVSPNTLGVIELQSGSDSDPLGTDSIGWGGCQDAQGVYKRSGNCKLSEVAIRQAYISHQGTGLLGVLSGFKVGHMPIRLGNGIFYNHGEFGDDAIVLFTQPVDGTEIAFAIVKGDEGNAALQDDVDSYTLSAETSVDGIYLNADVTFLNDNAAPGGIVPASSTGTDLWNIGLRGKADISGFNISADVEIQTGEIENGVMAGQDLDLSGWAAEVKVSTKVNGFGLKAGVGYGSGDDIDTANDFEGFITSLSNGQDYTYLYDQKVITGALGGRTGLSNTTYFNVGASTNVNPDTKVSADIYYLLASEKVSNVAQFDSEDIGIEVDGKITYQIDTNLVWYVEAGYLFADDFYKNVTGLANTDPDDAYSVRHGILFTF